MSGLTQQPAEAAGGVADTAARSERVDVVNSAEISPAEAGVSVAKQGINAQSDQSSAASSIEAAASKWKGNQSRRALRRPCCTPNGQGQGAVASTISQASQESQGQAPKAELVRADLQLIWEFARHYVPGCFVPEEVKGTELVSQLTSRMEFNSEEYFYWTPTAECLELCTPEARKIFNEVGDFWKKRGIHVISRSKAGQKAVLHGLQRLPQGVSGSARDKAAQQLYADLIYLGYHEEKSGLESFYCSRKPRGLDAVFEAVQKLEEFKDLQKRFVKAVRAAGLAKEAAAGLA